MSVSNASVQAQRDKEHAVSGVRQLVVFRLGEGSYGLDIRVVRDLSQERGLNENIDGQIRQCFPKGRGSATITDSEIQIVIDKLNNCPRKCLRFKTPNQVFFGIKPDVALLYGLPKYYHSGVK